MIANIICLNSQYIHSSLAPWCLAAGVEQYGNAGVRAFVTEGTVNESRESLLERICAESWDLAGFCCYIWNITEVLRLCRELKDCYPERKIVLGGPEVGYTPSESLSLCPEADYVLSGAGEESFPLLCNALQEGREPREVPGLSTRFYSNPPVMPADPPSPYTPAYFAALKGRIAYLETMRGCPYSCAFCLSGGDSRLQFFPLERVKQELLQLAGSGTRTLKLVDRSFNADPGRAMELVSFLITSHREGRIPPEVCIHFEIEAMSLTEELSRLFCSAPAGLFRLEVGVQSFREESLRAVNRRAHTEKLKTQLRALTESEVLTVHADLIVGLPQEGLAGFRESFNTLFALSPFEIQVGFLKLLKGTPMRDPRRFSCRYSSLPPYEVQSTPWLSREEIRELKQFAQTVEKLYNSHRFQLTLQWALPYFESPFDLFFSFAQKATLSDQSLDSYTDALYDFLKSYETVPGSLRDLLVKDRFASCAERLSPLLKSLEKEKQKPKKLVASRLGKPAGRRAAAVLHSEKTVVFCDYDGGEYCQRDPVSKRFRFFFLPLGELT